MAHLIQKVITKDNYMLEATFFSGQIKQYDVKQLFNILPQFKQFQDQATLFKKVVVDTGGYGISWNEELDLDAETIWEDGILVEVKRDTDINHLVAYQLALARDSQEMTQKELAEKTGIYQADISRIERGIGNPSLLTLKRLADGMDMDIQVKFVRRAN